ncbi:MAG TPA: adenylate/guanylate cyclase domain-containing protein [Gammaproteobacteria bacterium]|nr:adenylate/guanylate cyclase domain-containing protein [Gammaproteobacteria bacterium]
MRNTDASVSIKPTIRPGTRLAPVVEWLALEGRFLPDLSALAEEICARVNAAGISVWRFRIGFRTIHPQLSAMGVLWIEGAGAKVIHARHGFEQSDDYLGSPIEFVFENAASLRSRLTELDPERDHSVLHSIARAGGTDYLASPLKFSDGGVNVLIYATRCADGFSDEDIRELEWFSDFLASVIEVFATRQLAVTLLDTYVGRRTSERVMQGKIRRGDGDKIFAVMWFSDLRDFTALTESLSPERMLSALNEYFELVAAAVTARGGEILRFIGDAMLIVFPVSSQEELAAACEAALDSADDAFSALGALNHRRRRAGLPPLRFGVGLHVGEVIYGNVGAPDRLDFTVMGPAVNRTARLESLTKTVHVPLLLSAEFVRHANRPARSVGLHVMKGISEPQEIFALDESQS